MRALWRRPLVKAVVEAGFGKAAMPSAKSIHIMHVVRRGFADGGMENGIVNVTNRLPDNYRVSICALDSQETFSSRITRPDSEFHLLPKLGSGIDWALVRRLAKLFRSSKTDLVHSHNWGTFLYAVLAAKLAGVRIIHGEHGKNEGEIDSESAVKYWAKSILGRRVDRLVTVSQVLASEWASYGVPASKIQWIPNGVDTERFRPRADQIDCRRKFGLPEDGRIIGSVGRLDALKNYEVLVAAFARLAPNFPDMHLALLGKGPAEQNLRNVAEQLGVSKKVYFLGHRHDPENFLAALNIFALPSKFEGMSNVVLEAMASGLPVVCADLPCHHEVFEAEKEGVLVTPCTAGTMAEALANLCDIAERRQYLSVAARKKVLAKFSIVEMVSEYERIYTQSVETSSVFHFRRT
jgi:sugar transferase (PEP-CTERM/EpsH1 system associated)